MKHLILLFILSINSVLAQKNHTLTVSFTGIKSDKGSLFIGLHNKKEDFLKKNFREAIVKITAKKATAIFKNIPQGNYTVAAFHDENNNKKMDTNFIGIPKEDYGISNNAKGFMGPPKHKNAQISITHNTEITIAIN